MKPFLLYILLSICTLAMYAQDHRHGVAGEDKNAVKTDSLTSKNTRLDSLADKKKRADTVIHRLGQKIDSLSHFQLSSLLRKKHQSDTVKAKKSGSSHQPDSFIDSQTDSVPKRKTHFDSLNYKKQRGDTAVYHVRSRLDSISHLKLSTLLKKRPPNDTTKGKSDTTRAQADGRRKSPQSDSLKEAYSNSVKSITGARDSLQQKTNDQINSVQRSIDTKTGFLDSLQMNVKDPITGKSVNYAIKGTNTSLAGKGSELKGLPSNELSLPATPAVPDVKPNTDVKIPDSNLLNKVNDQVSDLKQQPQKQLGNNGLLKDAAKIKEQVGQAGEVTKKAEVYQEDIKNIKEGGLEKAKALPEEAEKAASNLSQVKELQNETQKFEATKNVLQQYQDARSKMNEEQLLAQAKDAGSKQLADHFTGNEEKLKTGVAQLDKLKKKYGNIPDSRYLPKRAPNPMNGKPLIERLVPGVNLQIFNQRNLVNVDLSPFLAFKISPRWRAGLGGTYRFQFNKKVQLVEDNPAYGYRSFTNILIWGGLHFHLEGEVMRLIPYDFYSQSFNTEEGKRWIPGLHAGILKHYKVSKKINGNFQVLYNFLYERNGLYPNKVNMRFGFEFPMKKKVKKAKQV